MVDNDTLEATDRLVARWMVGGSTALADADVPVAWRDGTPLDPELRALALATQYRRFLVRTAPPQDAADAPVFPELPLPTVPETSRLRFRRALPSTRQLLPRGALLRLVTLRGFMPHPFDWQPEEQDDGLPPVYDAWRAWATHARSTVEVLDAESWDALAPALRRQLFARLRRQSPAAARELLALRLDALPADQRLALVDVLGTGLSIDDAPLLAHLATDRSEKVRSAAARLHARIGGRGAPAAEATDALRACFVLEHKGLLKRRIAVAFAAVKTRPQRVARRELVMAAGWDAIAASLGLASTELARSFAFGDQDDDALLQCAAGTADDASVAVLMERLLFEPASAPLMWALLVDRLDASARAALALRCLVEGSVLERFADVLLLAQACLPMAAMRALSTSTPMRGLRELATSEATLAGAPPAGLLSECAAAGCLLPPDAARHALQLLVDAGIRPGDPMLDTLHLNLQLAERATQGPNE